MINDFTLKFLNLTLILTSDLILALTCIKNRNGHPTLENHAKKILHDPLGQGRATFSERGPDQSFRSSSWAGVTNDNPKMRMYITIRLLQRRLVLIAMKTYVNVRWMSSTTEECH